jgi:lipoprotein-anchoring transpeptidase ErfK/SrfK
MSVGVRSERDTFPSFSLSEKQDSGYNSGMAQHINRREFLKFAALAMPGLAIGRNFSTLQKGGMLDDGMVGRITIDSVSVYSEPWDESAIVFQRYRDELVNLYSIVDSTYGPEYNRRWYRVWGGYIHSGRIQVVQSGLNSVVTSLAEEGRVGQVTVPITYQFRLAGKDSWVLLHPLYYESVHWVTGVIEGPNGQPYYQITEAWGNEKAYVMAKHVRLIPYDELTPISSDVPSYMKRIEISIAQQTIIAYEDQEEVFKTSVSTGLNKRVPGEIPWNTPTGEFHIVSKMPSQRMGNDPITSDISGYVLPGVPWVCFFHNSGYAIHGTYWHNNYGVQMSHGCVNMRPEEAKWIFRWSTPAPDEGKRETRGQGTRVIIR